MSTHTQILYHIVFGTKDRKPTLTKDRRDDLYKYIWGILHEKGCHLYRIGGAADHVHILCEVKPTKTVSEIVKTIKVATTFHIRDEGLFIYFTTWQEGYGAFTCSWSQKDSVIEYIRNQEEHHRRVTFEEEFAKLLEKSGVEYEAKYLV